MYKILSVDWDYFFPDVVKYDWQMNEDHFIYYEMIWPLRWSNFSIFDQSVKAKEDMWPRISFRNFWDDICPSFNGTLSICDSHLDILKVIDFVVPSGEELTVCNFDQHHDWGYGETDEVNCGNWAKQLEPRLIDFWQIYPDWRRFEPEKNLPDYVVFNYEEELIPDAMPDDFDLVFICRSSPWTPAWTDRLWLRFIEYWKGTVQWRSKIAVDYVLKEREFNFKKAINLDKQMTKRLKEMNYGS